MPRTVEFKEDIQKIRMELWVKVYSIAEEDKSRRYTPSKYASDAVDAFDRKFKTENLE